MDSVTCTVIFILGGVATVIVMRLLFLFWKPAVSKNAKTTSTWSR